MNNSNKFYKMELDQLYYYFIEYLVQETMNGRFGNGDERKKKLGAFYVDVQNSINFRLGYSKRHTKNEFCN